ncbi:Hydrogen peroxide-inducible genes activator =_ OxyR [hydrothermal vent metagenome]|uniref:Hydrogen peroxide-inducible genes activator => OxyR n=1 Tax=hydrothermal vent metagenome TaxID=652676 RepID=A0A3B0URI1_9ZZZZ
MTLVQLEYIVAVDEKRHFAEAAKRCFVTQPTLSMQIQKLEEQLEIQIFDRSKHPVLPTKIGELIIKQARIILMEAAKLKAVISEEKEILSGELKVGIIPTLSPYLLPLFIHNFLKTYPDINLEIQELITDQIIEKIERNQLDIGIIVTPIEHDYIEELPLFYEEFVAYVSNSNMLFKKLELTGSDINLKDVWVLNEGHCFRNQVLNICKPRKSESEKFRFECGSLEALKKIVDHHNGLTLLPELATLDMTDGELEKVRTFADPVPVREVSLVVHKSFAKQGLTKALYNSVKKSIPDDISSKKSGKVIKWR